MVKRLSVIFAVFFAFCSLLTADQADEKKLPVAGTQKRID